MIRDHNFYEMQSALAAVGQLSEAELAELEKHANGCVSCHQCIAEMAEVSRELFLLQPRNISSKEVPAGMQERFLEWAANIGILMGRPNSARLDLRFAQISVIVLLLVAVLSLSGKMLSAPDKDRGAAHSPVSVIRSSQVLETASVSAKAPMVQDVSTGNAQVRRRLAVRRRTVSIPSTQGARGGREPGRDLSKPFFAAQGLPAKTLWHGTMLECYLAAGLHSSKPSSFTKEYVARFFGREADSKPDEQAFHYDLKLASLSFQESSLDDSSRRFSNDMQFNTSAFQIDLHRAW